MLGTAFMFCKAPTWRFGLGYVFIIPALAVAILQNRYGFRIKRSYDKIGHAVALSMIGMLILFIVPSGIVFRSSHELMERTEVQKQADREVVSLFNFLLPPRTWEMEYDQDRNTGEIVATPVILKKEAGGDFIYYHSLDGETCWDAPLPCSPTLLAGIQLRDPAQGIAGGFIRIEKPEEKRNER